MTKAPAKSKVKKENENIMKHVVELNERLSYVMDVLTNQAHAIEGNSTLLERIRIRMGL